MAANGIGIGVDVGKIVGIGMRTGNRPKLNLSFLVKLPLCYQRGLRWCVRGRRDNGGGHLGDRQVRLARDRSL